MTTLSAWVKRHPVVTFFVLAFAITWAAWIPRAAASQGLLAFQIPPILSFVAGYGPSLAAIIVTGVIGGKVGLRELLSRVLRWRVGIQWYLVVLFMDAVISLLVIALYVLLGGPMPDFANTLIRQFGPPGAPVWMLVPPVFLFLLVQAAFQEEIGWRGFALPQLQVGRSALSAALILGVFWALWHLPFFWTKGAGYHDYPWLRLLLLGFPAVSILLAWVYNNTRGSVLLPILWHAAANTTAVALPLLALMRTNLTLIVISVAVTWALALLVVAIFGAARLSRKSTSETEADLQPLRPLA